MHLAALHTLLFVSYLGTKTRNGGANRYDGSFMQMACPHHCLQPLKLFQ
ncbi:hypothetical protein HNQ64_000083 [Prosthecobacter dejongeii]|uniref:Uncharacterized protein n=1 Tax=Prosthecobacter dejongeii TaxID=48465 RepID=A0A7W7YGS8_9BACT|nr:hypothetical protein [Prosthecobacter dejongeii]